jgi:outer membrane lipoprotein LolB
MAYAHAPGAWARRLTVPGLALCMSACASIGSHPSAVVDPLNGQNSSATATAIEPLPPSQGISAQPTELATPTVTGQWEGRLSLKLGAFGPAPASGSQMAFELDVKRNDGTLALATPLGTRMAMVRWKAAAEATTVHAQLETSEGIQAFSSLEDLTQQLLGEALPLQAMLHWMQGHPAPGLTFEAAAGQNPATPNTFKQAGWLVDASELAHGRLNAQREESPLQRSVTLRLRFDL